MKLEKLYTNKDKLFHPITFNDGLNVVLGEIHLQKDTKKDTHNLGKSTLCRLIDFCLLLERDKDFFLFRHEDIFGEICFYLELEISAGKYLTIKRNVAEASKIWLVEHNEKHLDARALRDEDWTQSRLPFDKAKMLVDGYLGLDALKPWTYRMVLAYLLRRDTDFTDVFKPKKFKGADKVWKPFLLHILGFNEKPFERRYRLEDEKTELQEKWASLSGFLAGEGGDLGQFDALIAIKRREVEQMQKILDDYKFEPNDKLAVGELVDVVEEQIASLNDQRYGLLYSIAKIEKSLEKEKLLFSTNDAKRLFEEVGVLFDGQIKKDFDQLIEFNKDITEERNSYLKSDLKDSNSKLEQINNELHELDEKRAGLLKQIGSRDSLAKFKQAANEIVNRRTEIEVLKQKRLKVSEAREVKNDLADKEIELNSCKAELEEEIDRISNAENDKVFNTEQDILFSKIREEFDLVVNNVLDHHGALSVSSNKEGHAEFQAEILNPNGQLTSASEGETYCELLCIAFDLALVVSHSGKGFPSFVYHDNAFSGLDLRKKSNLLSTMREYGNRGVQQIITAIDSDMPAAVFKEGEIILHLNDEGDEGRLFKMHEW